MKNKALPIILILLGVLVVGGAIYFSMNPVGQSIISSDEVYLSNGKAFWLYTFSVNNLNEKVTFTDRNPETYTKSDGTEIRPQDGLTISLSKRENSCEYRAEKRTESKLAGLVKFNYYVLNNPERIALIDIEDGNNVKRTIDATNVQSLTIPDTDGSGQVTIQTQGILGGKIDCANYENVAIFYDNNDNIRIVEKNSLENRLDESILLGGLSALLKDLTQTVSLNTQFTTSFENYGFDGNSFLGTLNFGNALITVTADQDYYDSVVYTPPKEVDPKIDKLNCPSEIKQDGTGTMSLVIKNRENSEGTVFIDTDSNDFTINPSSTNVLLKDLKTVNFNLKATNEEINNARINVEVCSTNQFGSNNCDDDSCTIDITKEEPDLFCGDNICSASIGETQSTCLEDCGDGSGDGGNLQCNQLFQTKVTKTNIFGTTKTKCALSTWVYIAFGSLIIGLLILISVLKNRRY